MKLSNVAWSFLCGADELRFVDRAGFFHKTPKVWYNIYTITFLRSLLFKNPKMYLFVLDIDSPSFTQETYDLALQAADIFYGYTRASPILKYTGGVGAQVIKPFIFQEADPDMNRLHLMVFARRIARELDLPFRKGQKKDGKIFVDSRMFDKNRMIFGFGYRYDHKRYSIPFLDTYKKTRRVSQYTMKAILKYDFPPIDMSPIEYQWKWGKYILKKRGDYTPIVRTSPMPKDDIEIAGPDILPPRLKYVALREADPDHDTRWNLVAFLRWMYGMSPEEIYDFIIKHTVWRYAITDRSTTMYQIRWTVRWVDEVTATDPQAVPVRRRFLSGWENLK